MQRRPATLSLDSTSLTEGLTRRDKSCYTWALRVLEGLLSVINTLSAGRTRTTPAFTHLCSLGTGTCSHDTGKPGIALSNHRHWPFPSLYQWHRVGTTVMHPARTRRLRKINQLVQRYEVVRGGAVTQIQAV